MAYVVMPCYHPLPAWRLESGDVVFVDRGAGDRMDLPCGRCIGCRLERSRQWATRIMFESQFHDANSFITLTYDEEHVPFPPSLNYVHFQKFMKRLRKRLGVKIRFYMCGEYGEEFGRPHFHACIFGSDFPDRVPYSRTGSGHVIYRSPLLEACWPFGFSSVADLSFESAAYVARYVMKKVTGDLAEEHYRFIDGDSGEVFDRVPEFCHMSLKPGIGADWFHKYSRSDMASDVVVINGRECKPPRYFDKLLKRVDPDEMRDRKEQRDFSAYQRRADNSDDRLRVKEVVKRAALKQLKRRGDL